MPLNHDAAQRARLREESRVRKPQSNRQPRPITEDTVDRGRRYSISERVQCLTLITLGHDAKFIQSQCSIPPRTQQNLWKKAVARGYNPSVDPRILDSYVIDGARSGRPKEIGPEIEEEMMNNLRINCLSREKSSEVLAYEVGISHSSALRILRRLGARSVKPTTKPGLSTAQKLARLEFCLWIVKMSWEEFKSRVVFTDETSVVLGVRRGTIRIWRLAGEAYELSCVRRRWSGFCEFMFWGSFTYDRQGPCHIWTRETAQEKKAAEQELAEINSLLEPKAKKEWELLLEQRRSNLRERPRGKKPTWKFTKKLGKLERSNKGGIDWFRYRKQVLEPLLLPFAKMIPNAWVLEDGAPAHNHHANKLLYKTEGVQRLPWPGNSPDLNAIEKAWPWMKKVTTIRGATMNPKRLRRQWEHYWRILPAEQRHKWIRGVWEGFQEVIRLEGDNNYKEGRPAEVRDYKGLRIVGKLSPHAYLNFEEPTMALTTVLNPEYEIPGESDDSDTNSVE
jgi:hypothetical protein